MLALGAMPFAETVPFEATMPATFVPWPLSSRAAPVPLCEVRPFGQHPYPDASSQKHCSSTIFPAKSAWLPAMPLSRIATVTPWPVYPSVCTTLPRTKGTLTARCARPPTSRSMRPTSGCSPSFARPEAVRRPPKPGTTRQWVASCRSLAVRPPSTWAWADATASMHRGPAGRRALGNTEHHHHPGVPLTGDGLGHTGSDHGGLSRSGPEDGQRKHGRRREHGIGDSWVPPRDHQSRGTGRRDGEAVCRSCSLRCAVGGGEAGRSAHIE